MFKEAVLYKTLEGGNIQCFLCAHRCFIKIGQLGKCKVRLNQGGNLFTLNYGKLIAKHVDPIEKKPLFHFFPGSVSYSIASPGCNFTCAWCQNWEISQYMQFYAEINVQITDPDRIVAEAEKYQCKSISYTYTEPTVFFEYTYDVSLLAKHKEIKNIYVTNGYMSAEMINLYAPLLDAANVDIKGFSEKVYQKYIGGHLLPVLEACKKLKQKGIWLEITTLVIPNLNDNIQEIKSLAAFIYDELGSDTPWHISRYYPNYQIENIEPTPMATLKKLYEIGKTAGLEYVYLGNVGSGADTICPICNTIIIKRWGNKVIENRASASECPNCHKKISGIGI